MVRLEDIQNKSELVGQYYSWLFDSDDITLLKKHDIALVPTSRDPHIYYPSCMNELFETQALQRYS